MKKNVIGIDFGTESARAVLVAVESGEILASRVHAYSNGVIDECLPHGNATLPPDWALQYPGDWLTSLEKIVGGVLEESGVPGPSVIGLGLDFTACTVLPTTAQGKPLCEIDEFKRDPHAWAKLWKHHAAQPQADRVNERASERREIWLGRYGGKISSEWLLPKALQILEEAPGIYQAAEYIVEGADWVVWQLAGELSRNACTAGYKALWHKQDSFPSSAFLQALNPGLADLYVKKVAGPVIPPGKPVGRLTESWAGRLGLPKGIPVAAPIIDAHAAVPGGGIAEPGIMFMIMGTSTCHMLMANEEVLVEGIAGVVEDGIVPGFFGYEAGQAGVGDIFAWLVEQGVPPSYHEESERQARTLHEVLSDKAARLRPGKSGLLALDWWNGNRSTLVDADLSGMIIGCTLSTRVEEIYRALIESTAFGTRVIIEAFTDGGIPVDSIVTGGGLTQNPLLMQIYADVTGREMAVAGSAQVSALGAAMLAAVAAGRPAGGYDSLGDAVKKMAPPPARVYRPIPQNRKPYATLYAEYRRLYDCFGRGENEVMKVLRRLRQ